MKKKQQTKRLTAMAFAVMLAACIPAGKVRMVYNLEQDVELTQLQGIIIARVINASPYSQTFNYITLAPKSVYEKKDNKFERIEASQKLSGKSTIFAAPLPAGNYSLSDIYSYHYYIAGNYSYYFQLRAGTDPKFGTFKVEPGKITNLGTIIYYQKPDGDKFIQLLARKDEFKEALEYLENEKPWLYKQIDTSATLSWDEDDYAPERHNLYLNIAQNPVTFDKAYPQEDGSWFFTSKLGVMLHRTAQGQWNIEAIDGHYDIVQFSRNFKDDLAAMDERGSFFLKLNGAHAWVSIPKPVTDGTIGCLALDNSGDIHVIAASKNKIEVISGRASNNPGWTTSLTYEPHLGWLPPGNPAVAKFNRKGMVVESKIKDFSAVMAQGKILVATNGKVYELKPELGQATELAIDFAAATLENNAYNQLSLSRYTRLDRDLEAVYTLDAGATWRAFSDRYDICPGSKKKNSCDKSGAYRFKSRKHIGVPVFFADGQGYSIIREVHTENTFLAPPERTTTYRMVVSMDGGKTWMRSTKGDLPKYCNGLRKGPDEQSLLLSCEYATGQFYKADRETLSWQIDYQPALF